MVQQFLRNRVMAAAVIACMVFGYNSMTYAQNNWSWKNPLPTGNTLLSIAGNDRNQVAISDAATVLVSSDSGKTWLNKDLILSINFYESAFFVNRFFVLGYFNSVMVSSDNGMSWNWRIGAPAASDSSIFETFFGMASNGTQLVIVGSGGFVSSSSDSGITWVQRISPTIKTLNCILWDGNKYRAFGDNGTSISSSDGENWTAITTTGVGDVTLKSVAKSGSLYVGAGSDANGAALVVSTDGIAWTHINLSAMNLATSVFHKILWTGTQFAVIGDIGTVLTSPDGSTWTMQNTGITSNLNGIMKVGSKFLAIGSEGTIVTSDNGAQWTKTGSTVSTKDINSIIWATGKLVAVGNNGQVLTSTDGTSWTARVSGFTVNLHKVILAAGRLLAAGDNGTILSSPDALTWTTSNVGVPQTDIHGIAYSGSLYVAIGDNGTIVTSSDGTNWTSQNSGVTDPLLGVTWTGTQFIAVGANTTMVASADGITWSPRTITVEMPTSLSGVASNGRTVVAVGDDSGIFTSVDGTTWTTASWLFGQGGFQDVCWTGTRFVAVGVGGTIYASKPDSETVFNYAGNPIRSGRTSTNLNGVAVFPTNQIVAVGANGTIMTSGSANAIRYTAGKTENHGIRFSLINNAIHFSLPSPTHMLVRVFTVEGKIVAVLADKMFERGSHSINLRSLNIAQGTYVVQLHTENGDAQKPLVVVR